VSLDPSSDASAVVGERPRGNSHTSTLTKEADGVLISRAEPIFEFADRGVGLPRNLSGGISQPRLLYIIDQE
jgi:hypothetical protein